MRRGKMVGRSIVRSAGQIAISVVATLIATQIYAGLQHAAQDPAAMPRPAPSVTSGGKYDARIPGVAPPPLPESVPPVLSIVDWAITPQRPTAQLADLGWSTVDAGPASVVSPTALKPVRRDAKHSAATAVAPAPVRSAAVPQLDLHPAPAAPEVERVPLLWSVATTTAHSIVALGGSAVALGGSALGRILP